MADINQNGPDVADPTIPSETILDLTAIEQDFFGNGEAA